MIASNEILKLYKIPLYSLNSCINDPEKAKRPAIPSNSRGFLPNASKSMTLNVFGHSKSLNTDYFNYGILTGKINNLVVVDLDCHKKYLE